MPPLSLFCLQQRQRVADGFFRRLATVFVDLRFIFRAMGEAACTADAPIA